MTTIADRIYDAQIALGRAEEDFDDELSKWLGRPWWEEPALAEDTAFDVYDRSFELIGCPVELRIPAEVLPAIWEAGFHRFWLNHTDGTETAYARGSTEGYTRVSPLAACRKSATPAAPETGGTPPTATETPATGGTKHHE